MCGSSHEVVTVYMLIFQSTPYSGIENNLLAEVLIIVRPCVRAYTRIPRSIKRSLRLRRLALLPPLLRSLLILHLLIAQRSQTRRNLLDLLAGQILRDLLDELLQEQRVLPLLRVCRNQRLERLAQLGELVFCGGLEERERGEVDGVARGGLVGYGDVFRGLGFGVDGELAEELFGLGTGAVDFLLAKAGAALGFGFLLVGLVVVLQLSPAEGCLSVLLDPLRLGLVVCFSLSFCLGLGLVGLLGLFALDFRVFGGVP
jgi:hypothetical protein